MNYDNVKNPPHYAAYKIQPIEFIKSVLTPEEFTGYCKGNILKYVSRERLKNGKEDLEKARQYLSFAIKNYPEETKETIEFLIIMEKG